ncbi:MAG: bifunctional metallophosphatase/5'-nucleotidase [Actinomycetota bacterium]
MRSTRPRVVVLVAALLTLVLGAAMAPASALTIQIGARRTVDVQLLSLNDFHGALEPPAGSAGRIGTVDAGGVEFLATHIKSLEAGVRHSRALSAGDLIGASPLLSALFHDEPTIEAMNLIGLDYNAVGNHEFDEGAEELVRMQEGGCHPVDGCVDGDPFAGADFEFLAANVLDQRPGKRQSKLKELLSRINPGIGAVQLGRAENTFFPPYAIENFDGVKIGIIGMTLEGTPSIVTPSGIAGLRFLDEADTVNRLVPELKRRGVETIVVLLHEGGLPTGGFNECPGISGPIVDIVNRTDDEVDLFITGHTHTAYNCLIDGRPVTSAASNGRLVTDFDLTIDRVSREITTMKIDNKIVTRTVPKDGDQTSLLTKYKAIADPLANRVIGQITSDITRTATAAGETALGDVIADAQLAATAAADQGGAVIAFKNPGGIRSDLTFASSSVGEGDGNVTYGEAFTVQPFGNNLVTITLTGAQIDSLLEQQFNNPVVGQNRILQVSDGFSYSWSASAAAGSKVDPSSIKLNGVTISPATSYRVTVNSFLADGGDNFSLLPMGTNRLGGVVDTDALEAYFVDNSPVPPGPANRITRTT